MSLLCDIYWGFINISEVSDMSAKLILLNDVYDMRKRKEDELEFYHAELKKLMVKLDLVRQEISVTNQIIELIEREKVVDVAELVKKKSN